MSFKPVWLTSAEHKKTCLDINEQNTDFHCMGNKKHYYLLKYFLLCFKRMMQKKSKKANAKILVYIPNIVKTRKNIYILNIFKMSKNILDIYWISSKNSEKNTEYCQNIEIYIKYHQKIEINVIKIRNNSEMHNVYCQNVEKYWNTDISLLGKNMHT